MQRNHAIGNRFALAMLAALSVGLASAAEAEAQGGAEQPTDPSLAEAQRLRDEARDELAAGKVKEACDKLARSMELVPNEDGGFELAECRERAGDLEAAAKAYDAVGGFGGARAAEAKRRAGQIREKIAAAQATDAPPPPSETTAPTETPPTEMPLPPGGRAVETYGDAGDKPGPYHFSDYLDTRLTWTFGDDDVVHATGETTPLSPDTAIGDRPKYRLFFDNLNSQFGGRENLSHLVLYKKMPGFINRLDTEASMVLRFDLANLSSGTGNLTSSLYDAGSFIRVAYRVGDDPKDEKTNVAIVFWPLDTDRFRLGYLYDISWGGTNPRINQSIFPRIQGVAPGGKVEFQSQKINAYFGFKTAQIVQVEELLTPGTSEVEVVRVGETNYGWLGGGGVQIGDYVRLDAGGGYFQQGKFDLPDVLGKRVFTFGFSGRASVFSKGSGVSRSIDFALYRNDPMKHETFFRREKYDPDKTTWSGTVEYTNLWQNLKDFDTTAETFLQQARAAAVQGNVKTGFFRASLTGIYRDLPFVLRNVPSFVPFETLPLDADVGDEIFIATSFDYHFDGPRLTPGLGAGLQFPATFTTSALDQAGDTIGRTVVVRSQGDVAILPVDAEAVPIFQARASLRWDVSEMLGAIVWLQYIRDNNGTFVERDPNEGTVALRTFVSPNFLGFGTSVQARF